jgi:hypothetical protein
MRGGGVAQSGELMGWKFLVLLLRGLKQLCHRTVPAALRPYETRNALQNLIPGFNVGSSRISLRETALMPNE